MNDLIRAESFRKLLSENAPLLDVRAPLEFSKGAFPGSINLPLLEDEERDAIGKIYKKHGQQAAIDAGYKLVNGDIRKQRLQQWTNYIDKHLSAVIYCFRGGLRSRIAQQWLAEAGYDVPRIAGGYKALRGFLINTITSAASTSNFLLVAGKTGCDKTALIHQFQNNIDLEGIANHRGSAFGNRVQGQPTQINFENNLAIALLQLPYEKWGRIVAEDESRAIGSLSTPIEFHSAMGKAPVAVIEQDIDYRVDTILNAYIATNYSDFIEHDPLNGAENFTSYLFNSLQRIKKRLGEQLFREISEDMQAAISNPNNNGFALHRIWIEKLLTNYYDPMYDYQLAKKSSRIVFRGRSDEFLRWASHIDFKMDRPLS